MVSWIKIRVDMFDDEKIKLIESMPDCDAILVVWIKLLALAGKSNRSGCLMITENIPYTDEMLAAIFHRPLNTIRLALSTFERFGMIDKNDSIYITNWEKHQNEAALELIRAKDAERKRKSRLHVTDMSRTCHGHDADCPSLDIDIDIELDKDKENTTPSAKKETKHKHGEHDNVLLTDAELSKLKDEYTEPITLSAIDYLSAYKAEKGYSTKSDYLTLRRWVFDAVSKVTPVKQAKPTTKTCGACGSVMSGPSCHECGYSGDGPPKDWARDMRDAPTTSEIGKKGIDRMFGL